MKTVNFVQRNRYQDSVTLMQVAVGLRAIEGIEDAALMMGSAPNKEMLLEAGLITGEGEEAGPNDLIVAFRGEEDAIEAASGKVEELLRAQSGSEGNSKKQGASVPHSLAGGLAAFPETNFVLISTPGIYAAVEAQKALATDRHVMIFSDNVSIEDEVKLKREANERGLLLLGPDCGTAIIGGVPLGFANAVRRGPVGVVGASGTGMQEITTLVDRFGGGISHAIGTGSHDLSAKVGALTTLAGLAALGDDKGTKVIVVVSKPPDSEVAEKVLKAAGEVGKPVVICFLGLEESKRGGAAKNVTFADSLEDAARKAVGALSGGILPMLDGEDDGAINSIRSGLLPGQKYVRGLFSGGTFCYEAMLILEPMLGAVYSNTPLRSEEKVVVRDARARIGGKHLCLDLGSDEFTVGRPHPMIDMTLRAERIVVEAEDPETAVILLDVVLGYGAHPDPAGALAPSIRKAKVLARGEGREVTVIAYVCGTESDSQGFGEQKALLEEVGAVVVASNAGMARLAGMVVGSR